MTATIKIGTNGGYTTILVKDFKTSEWIDIHARAKDAAIRYHRHIMEITEGLIYIEGERSDYAISGLICGLKLNYGIEA